MMTHLIPVVGDWYKMPGGHLFEVVALDTDDGTIEVQHYDGTIEELDDDTWSEMYLQEAKPPEDYSGSVDMDREDYGFERDESHDTNMDMLRFVDRAD